MSGGCHPSMAALLFPAGCGTPKSKAIYEKAKIDVPFGVHSNYRYYPASTVTVASLPFPLGGYCNYCNYQAFAVTYPSSQTARI